MLLVMAWTAGCAGDGDEPPDATTGHTGTSGTTTAHTGTPPPPEALTATCAQVADNTLRYQCVVEVDPPGPVELTWARADGLGAVRTVSDGTVAASHTLDLVFLANSRDYTWTARGLGVEDGPEVDGAFTTERVPAWATATLAATGTSSAPYVGVLSPCGQANTALIYETATSELVWYQRFVEPPAWIEAVSFTEDHTVLAMGSNQVFEADLAGRHLLQLDSAAFDGFKVHHDLFRRAGRTYVLFQEPVGTPAGTVLVDGFFVFEGEERVGQWRLADTVLPEGPGIPPLDWSHANSVWVDADSAHAYVSFRHLSGIVKVDVDPDSPTAWRTTWRLAPENSQLGTDFSLTSAVPGPADFYQQHNVHVLPDGRLTMFDNRAAPEVSRLVDLSVDEAGGAARIERTWVLPDDQHCDFQGGAWRTAAGNPMATCAPYRTAWEFDAEDGTVVWQGEVRCLGEIPTYLPRFTPLDW